MDLAASGKLSDTRGIQVSNAGGWHSKPNFFAIDDDAVTSLYEQVKRCVLCIEGRVDAVCGASSRLLDLDRVNIEAWFNVSGDGNWNRLHTHCGSAWSAVYYVDKGVVNCKKGYSGRLVLKPTPHRAEDEWQLKGEEEERFVPCDGAGGGSYRGEDKCDYYDLEPEDGALIVFPSWLHHAVLPYTFAPKVGGEERERVSIAMNVNSLNLVGPKMDSK